MDSDDEKPKRKKRRRRKPKPPPLPGRSYYEEVLTNLNRQLAALRKQKDDLEKQEHEQGFTMRQMKQDRADVSTYLERIVEERNETINIMEKDIKEKKKQRNEQITEKTAKIKDLDVEYKTMHEYLTSELDVIKRSYDGMENVRRERDFVLNRFDEIYKAFVKNPIDFKEELFKKEQSLVVEHARLKQEVEEETALLIEEFTRSSDIRLASYTRQIIRENIALKKQFDNLVEQQIKLKKQIEAQEIRQRTKLEELLGLRDMKEHLFRNLHHKDTIILELTSNYSQMKIIYLEAMRFRSAYEQLMFCNSTDEEKFKGIEETISILRRQVEILFSDKKQLATAHHGYDKEITRLNKVLQDIKDTLCSAVRSLKRGKRRLSEFTANDVPSTVREGLFLKLLGLVCGPEKYSSKTSEGVASLTLYKRGRVGLLQPDRSSDVDLEICPDISTEGTVTSTTPVSIPEVPDINDVEVSSTFYASSTTESRCQLLYETESNIARTTSSTTEASSSYESSEDTFGIGSCRPRSGSYSNFLL